MPKIKDSDILTADPEEVVRQYRPFVFKLAGKYKIVLEQIGSVDFDDLVQVGCIALLSAQRTYDYNKGFTFISWSAYSIKSAIRRELGFKQDGTLPPQMISLDEPINDEESEGQTRIDNLQDPDGKSPEEKALEESARNEIRKEVNAAIDRLQNENQRQIIRKVYLEGQDKQTVANNLGITLKSLQHYDTKARKKMFDDIQLRHFVLPHFSVSISEYKQTFTSAVEKAVLWKEKQFDELFGTGSFAELIRRKAE